MYITEVLTKSKTGKISHRCILLRESYRDENKKNKNRTIANITHCSNAEIEAIKLALKYKNDIEMLKSIINNAGIKQGISFGAVWLCSQIANQIGITKALGNSLQGKLALWQIISRVLSQASCLKAVRLAERHAACDILEIKEPFNEDHLYENLDWISENQEIIENNLFNYRFKNKSLSLFLYDVTSSYMEGTKNELSDWGYNRDKKKGKKQVVIGLLCDDEGYPVSIEVFKGNTNDTATFSNQIEKAVNRFKCKFVTFVGDRGMIKSAQIKQIEKENYLYITAITKVQVETLLKNNIIQMELFDKNICEVINDGVRFVFRKNSYRADEIKQSRENKKSFIEKLCIQKTEYLKNHPKAKEDKAKQYIQSKINKLKISDWLNIERNEKVFTVKVDEEKLAEESKLDGCYVIKSNLPELIDKQIIHDRYKDLSKVELAFKVSKTEYLEMRPWYVRKEERTRGRSLVIMMSYMIIKKLKECWKDIDLTVKEGIEELKSLSINELVLEDGSSINLIPKPNKISEILLKKANVTLPKLIPNLKVKVVSRKKLQKSRK